MAEDNPRLDAYTSELRHFPARRFGRNPARLPLSRRFLRFPSARPNQLQAARLIGRFLVLFLAAASAPAAFASGPYIIGSSNTVTADPNLPRPSTKPCIVQLMSNAEFDNFNPVSFPYAPPDDCPGPWAKVVFTADINVTAGIQYDRTANFPAGRD